MKVLLVRPKFPVPELRGYPPFGLITVAPYFKDEPAICDLQAGNSFEHALAKKPDVIAFSCFSSQLQEVNRLAQQAKQLCHAKTVAGGPGITASPEYAETILKDIDLLVVGDGECFAENLPQLDLEYVGKVHYPFFDLDQKKVPAWHMIDYKRYRGFPGFAVETSRGCCFNCCWCTAHMVHGKIWQPRKPESVVEELRLLKEQYGCRMFYFPDDNATVDPKRWVTLMQQIIDANLNVELHVPEGIQAHHLTFETLVLMKKAGFKLITIGAESGVQRVLDKVIDKGGLQVEQTEQVVRDCTRIGLTVNCFFVVGSVGETLDEAETTVDFAEKLRKLGAYNCMVRNAIPIPGTRMFALAKEKGCLTVPEKNLYDSSFIHSEKHYLTTPEWRPEQIEALVHKAKVQDAKHILHAKKGYIFKKGMKRLFTNPVAGFSRLRQIMREARKE